MKKGKRAQNGTKKGEQAQYTAVMIPVDCALRFMCTSIVASLAESDIQEALDEGHISGPEAKALRDEQKRIMDRLGGSGSVHALYAHAQDWNTFMLPAYFVRWFDVGYKLGWGRAAKAR